MRLDFVGFEVFFVRSFQHFWIVVSLQNLVPAWLVSFGLDVIRLEVVMIGGLSVEFGIAWWTAVLAWFRLKNYRMCRFDKRISCCITKTRLCW